MPINSFIYPGAKVTTAYEVANSCKFDRASSAYMDKSSGTSSNNDIYTLSFWMKRAGLEISDNILFSIYKDANNRAKIGIGPADSGAARDHKLELYDWYGGSQILNQVVDVHLMDPSSWYHICIRVDTTQSTANDRIRVYINGVDQASNITRTTTPNQNQNLGFQETTASNQWRIGSHNGGGDYYDGYLAEVVYCDGQSYAPTEFGEFDEDSPTIWKPKDVSGLTVGTNGFYLDFEDSSNLGNDANGGTDLAENGIVAADQATDTPTNNFCTISPIDGGVGTYTFSEGNCQIQGTSTSWYTRGSTFAVTKGKWYWEIEFDAGTMIEIMVGIHDTSVDRTATNRWVTGSTLFYNDNGGEVRVDGTETTADYGTLTAGDIMGIALNMDDKQITIYDNGSAIISNLSIGSNITEAMPTFLTDSTDVVFKANFGGCPAFSISSGNSDGNGYGNFEYAVPSGYYALCSKNLAEFG